MFTCLNDSLFIVLCCHFETSPEDELYRPSTFFSTKDPRPELHPEAQLQHEAHAQLKRVKSAYEQQQEQQRLEAQRAEERRQIQMHQQALQVQRDRVLKEREQRLKEEKEREQQHHREADRREQLLREEHQRSGFKSELKNTHFLLKL